MKRQKRREAERKILETKLVRRLALYGLVLGMSFIFLGILTQLPPLLIVGYTCFILCTGIFSFLTVLNWLSEKPLEREYKVEMERKTSYRPCPRCGAKMRKDVDYCRKCGKKMLAKE